MAKSKKRVSRKDVTALSAPQLPAEAKKTETVRFDYIKSNCFRVIRVDGAHGSPTPKGDGIQVAFFSERHPIPQTEEYVIEKGKVGKRINITARAAIVREVEVEAILSIEIAKQLEIWLHDKIRQIENLRTKGNSNG